jgi:MoaA/NifB/PqqE/SkfB family radical SAM enzyme
MSSGNPLLNELSTPEILALAAKLIFQGIKNIYLSGGEPVQHKDFFKIAQSFIDKGFTVSVITNATFSEAYYKKFLDIKFDKIYVSLDGLENTHNLFRRSGLSYKRVMNFLQFLSLNSSLDISVITCVSSNSIKDLEALHEELLNYRISEWLLRPVEMLGRAKEHPELFLSDNDREILEVFLKKNFHEDDENAENRVAQPSFNENMGKNKHGNLIPSLYSHPENLLEIMADGEFRNGEFRSQIQPA